MWEVSLQEASDAHARALDKYALEMAKYDKVKAEWEAKEAGYLAEEAAEAAIIAAAQAAGQKRPKGLKTKKQKDEEAKARKPPAVPKKPVLRMQEQEPVNFLRLATSLKLLLGQTISLSSASRSHDLYVQYLLGFREVSTLR